ncbi:hypothetical protein TELCIR_10381, partial [Teladorsagia circumcincta]
LKGEESKAASHKGIVSMRDEREPYPEDEEDGAVASDSSEYVASMPIPSYYQ